MSRVSHSWAKQCPNQKLDPNHSLFDLLDRRGCVAANKTLSVDLAGASWMPTFASKLRVGFQRLAVWATESTVFPYQATAAGVRTLIFLLIIH
jgi:hypothetical protein